MYQKNYIGHVLAYFYFMAHLFISVVNALVVLSSNASICMGMHIQLPCKLSVTALLPFVQHECTFCSLEVLPANAHFCISQSAWCLFWICLYSLIDLLYIFCHLLSSSFYSETNMIREEIEEVMAEC